MIVVSRIDAMTKIVGRDQSDTHENVHSGDVLPSKRAPVVLFLRNVDRGHCRAVHRFPQRLERQRRGDLQAGQVELCSSAR